MPGGGEPPPFGAPAAKLWYTQKLLQLAGQWSCLIHEGSYDPVFAEGRFGEHLFAFERRHEGGRLLVVVPRLVQRLLANGGGLGTVNWEDTRIPNDGRYISQLDGIGLEGDITPALLFARHPVAILCRE